MIAVARLAIAIGLAGLLPFLLGPLSLALWPEYSVRSLTWFYVYSAGILAFMAGVYWPIALQLENRCYPLSPVNTMIISQLFFVTAGVGLLLPVVVQILVYPVAYSILCVIDMRWMTVYWPQWYRRLRLVLTTVAVACQLMVGFWFFAVHGG